ncbi:hypothetical protein [Eubacterium sp.]|uniref:hypothetical protein n=1 Tax=Eubacterium sp. TaxID=142586 RepID=UPI0025D2104A|nr:hypothetical protein [Eubacterium sp.]MCR5629090.1 hypothetical protein [Eubacterium sp.]
MDIKSKAKKAAEIAKEKGSKGAKSAFDMSKKAGKAIGKGSKVAAAKSKEIAGVTAEKTKVFATKSKEVAAVAVDKSKDVAVKTKEVATKSKENMVEVLDQNGDGILDSTDLILISMKVPGVKVKRTEFLKKEFYKRYEQDVIDKAIETTPAKAGIKAEEIDKISDDVIKFERNAVSGISAALSMPGGAAMAATIPADIAQYYGYMLRAAQKLMYLYGFSEMDLDEDNLMLDSETINQLTLCLGVMYGVASATNAIKAFAKALGTGVEKKLLKTALTKGTIYPIVKSVANFFSIHMTKEVFAGFFKKAIPVAGGVVGGGLTFVTFKPCCDRLKKALSDTILSNPNHKETEEEKEMYENIMEGVVDVDYEIIDDREL